MKIPQWLFIGCLWFGSATLIAHAQQTLEFIEQLPSGSINWTRGVVCATGMSGPSVADQDAAGQTEPQSEYDQAYQQAVHNLMQTLARMRVNYQNCVSDLLNAQELTRAKVEEMTRSAKVVHTTPLAGGGVEVAVELALFGGFAQLMLPSDIRQVESIKPLNGNRPVQISKNGTDSSETQSARTDSHVYSGLLVDGRGTGACPSMVPVLLDESGLEVYGPAYVSREFAVQHGMSRYIRMPNNSSDGPQLASKPLIVKGLRTVRNGSCDLVISNADASKLRSASSHLEFLKQCQVVIILD